mmetsp:Transcript_7777/g.12353  ORF Transcript_7777/g.12353 Transcript_7777/m.12353 type:complete len:205 (-) Transcript_7777:1292-1906(-)
MRKRIAPIETPCRAITSRGAVALGDDAPLNVAMRGAQIQNHVPRPLHGVAQHTPPIRVRRVLRVSWSVTVTLPCMLRRCIHCSRCLCICCVCGFPRRGGRRHEMFASKSNKGKLPIHVGFHLGVGAPVCSLLKGWEANALTKVTPSCRLAEWRFTLYYRVCLATFLYPNILHPQACLPPLPCPRRTRRGGGGDGGGDGIKCRTA